MASGFFTSFTGYGKTGVRLLKIKRHNEKHHSIKEVEVDIELKLEDKKDYLYGDNAQVIPTDTQKNTIYALAKQHEVFTTCCACYFSVQRGPISLFLSNVSYSMCTKRGTWFWPRSADV